MDSLKSVLDPSDWLDSKLPPLYQLDSMIRCHICKEFMSSPVLTGCGHCFCSFCIRSSLESTGKCPLCNDEQIESKLRKNLILEEVIIFYKKYRADLRELLSKEEPHIEQNSSEPPELISLDSDNEAETGSTVELKRSSSPVSSVTSQQKKKQRRSQVSVMDRLIQSQNNSTSQEVQGECPICHEFYPLTEIETTHIDECLSGNAKNPTEGPKQKSTVKKPPGISSFFMKKTGSSTKQNAYTFDKDRTFQVQKSGSTNSNSNRPLKSLDYSSLNTSKLKEKLSLLSLPTTGTRLQLESRYDHYRLLYNSNLDSVNPMPLKQLRSNLNQWEFLNNNMDSNLMVTTKQKDIDRDNWTGAHKDEFKSLIAKARESVKKNKEESVPLESTDSTKTLADEKQSFNLAEQEHIEDIKNCFNDISDNSENQQQFITEENSRI